MGLNTSQLYKSHLKMTELHDSRNHVFADKPRRTLLVLLFDVTLYTDVETSEPVRERSGSDVTVAVAKETVCPHDRLLGCCEVIVGTVVPVRQRDVTVHLA